MITPTGREEKNGIFKCMNTHTQKSDHLTGEAVANSLSQKKSLDKPAFQVTDHRPAVVAQRKLQEMADNSPRVMQLKALQQMANNRSLAQAKNTSFGAVPVQLFKGAGGTNQEGEDIDVTFNAVFINKHVAENEESAIAKTQTRVTNRADDIGAAAIYAGNVGNTVATNAVWTTAMNENEEKIPGEDEFVPPTEEDKAEEGYNAAEFNDNGRLPDSSYMEITGWDVKHVAGNLVATEKTMNRKVGGDWKIEDLDVSLDIDHCTQ